MGECSLILLDIPRFLLHCKEYDVQNYIKMSENLQINFILFLDYIYIKMWNSLKLYIILHFNKNLPRHVNSSTSECTKIQVLTVLYFEQGKKLKIQHYWV